MDNDLWAPFTKDALCSNDEWTSIGVKIEPVLRAVRNLPPGCGAGELTVILKNRPKHPLSVWSNTEVLLKPHGILAWLIIDKIIN